MKKLFSITSVLLLGSLIANDGDIDERGLTAKVELHKRESFPSYLGGKPKNSPQAQEEEYFEPPREDNREFQDFKQKQEREIQGLKYEIICLKDRLAQQECEEEACYFEPPHVTTWHNRYIYPFAFEVTAEALYWTPTFGAVQYATLAPEPNQPQLIEAHYNWGYKLEGSFFYNCDESYFTADYINFRSTSSASVASPNGIIPVFSPVLGDNFDSATAEIESKFQEASLIWGYYWSICPMWRSAVFAGVRYVRIKEREHYVYFDPGEVVPATQRFTLNGWGPRFGATFSVFPFPCHPCLSGLEIKGLLGATIAIAHSTLLLETTPVGIGAIGTLNFPTETVTITSFDLKLELLYSLCFRKFRLKFAGGYELHYYEDARQRIATTNTLGIAPDLTSNLGYGGPFLGLSVYF